jgi:hypothetical protein
MFWNTFRNSFRNIFDEFISNFIDKSPYNFLKMFRLL